MKHAKSLKALFLFLAALVALTVLPVLSLANPPLYPDPMTDTDVEKLVAFWHQQTAADGVLNGDACYIVDIPEGAVTSFGGSYGGGALTPLVEDYYNYELNAWSRKFSFSFGIWVGGTHYDPSTGYTISWDDWDYPVRPDLYGSLDLAGTSFYWIENRHRNSTHITSMNFDNCESLARAQLGYQPFCTELSVLGCPNLSVIEAQQAAFERIAVQPAAFDAPARARVFGNGTICEVNFDASTSAALNLEAEDKDGFIGWFENGVLVEESRVCSASSGANLVACFGGDANGDGAISVADAVLALRAAMGSGGAQDAAMLDINGDGTVSVADAIMIARFALGVI